MPNVEEFWRAACDDVLDPKAEAHAAWDLIRVVAKKIDGVDELHIFWEGVAEDLAKRLQKLGYHRR